MEINAKVKRLRSDCCGMVEGENYDAHVDFAYVQVKLPNGDWTGSHWAGFNEPTPWFQIIEPVDKNGIK